MFDNIIGKSADLKALENLILNKRLAKILLFYGEYGTGKSTVAETVASLVTDKVIKVNMGLYDDKTNMTEIVNEIFKYKTVGSTCYILEEIHSLSRAQQTSLLEELKDTIDNTVIMITSELNSIIKPLRDRACLFKFKCPTESECLEFLADTGYNKDIKKSIVYKANRNPRVILKLKEVLVGGNLLMDNDIYEYLGIQSHKTMLDMLHKCKADSATFASYLFEVKNLSDIISNLDRFSKDLLCAYTGVNSVSKAFSLEVSELLKNISDEDVIKLVEIMSEHKKEPTLTLCKIRTILKPKIVEYIEKPQTIKVEKAKEIDAVMILETETVADLDDDEIKNLLGL